MSSLGRSRTSLTNGAIDILSNISAPLCSLNLQILDLARFQCDSSIQNQLDIPFGSENSLYELIITDGSSKLKGLLHPKNIALARQGLLMPSVVIQLSNWTHHPVKKPYDNDAFSYLVFEDLEVVVDAQPEDNVSRLASLQWKEYFRLLAKLKKDHHLTDVDRKAVLEELLKDLDSRPFVGNRGCYLHLWSDDCPIGEQWLPKDITLEAPKLANIFADSTEELTRLSDLTALFAAHRENIRAGWEAQALLNGTETPNGRVSMSVGNRFIVVRVLAKTRLTFYGSQSTDERWPFKFSLRVIDVSGIELNVDFWSAMCPALYYALKPGQIVKLSALRLREIYLGLPPTICSLVNGATLEPTFEITVNARGSKKPSCSVLTGAVADWFDSKLARVRPPLTADDVAERFDLTDSASSEKTIEALADALTRHSLTVPLHTVAGCVNWLGPIESRRVHGFAILTRWIFLLPFRDLHKCMLVQLAANSDIQTLDFLRKNDKVVLTHLRVEVHHSTLVGISSIYSSIQVLGDWAQAPDLVLPPPHKWQGGYLEAREHPPADWPLTLRCPETKEYDKLYGPVLYAEPPKTIEFLSRIRKDIVQPGYVRIANWMNAEQYHPSCTGWLTYQRVKEISKTCTVPEYKKKNSQGEVTETASFLWVVMVPASHHEAQKVSKNYYQYYCAVLPITAAHLCGGNMVRFRIVSGSANRFYSWVNREYGIGDEHQPVLFATCVLRIGDDVRHVLSNVWPDTPSNRAGLKTPVDLASQADAANQS
jgi:hypothetical protein